MKRLKFSEPLPRMILDGIKTATWRINDDKNIVIGDELSLCKIDGTEFGRAKAVKIIEASFRDLNEPDRKGHETYPSEEIMYETFSKYYNIKVGPDTIVKVIKFKLES